MKSRRTITQSLVQKLLTEAEMPKRHEEPQPQSQLKLFTTQHPSKNAGKLQRSKKNPCKKPVKKTKKKWIKMDEAADNITAQMVDCRISVLVS